MSVAFRSINPKNNKIHRTFEAISSRDLDAKIERSYQRFRFKFLQGFSRIEKTKERLGFLQQILRENRETYASLITQEMGKPIAQAEGEVDKCIAHLQYYADNMETFI